MGIKDGAIWLFVLFMTCSFLFKRVVLLLKVSFLKKHLIYLNVEIILQTALPDPLPVL